MKMTGSTLWVVMTSLKLTTVTGAIVAPVITVMRDDLGVGPVSAGLIITTHALFAALFYLPFERSVSRLGVKNLLVTGLLVYGAAGGAGLVITSYSLLLLSRALLGVGLAAVLTSITAILDSYTREEMENLAGLRGSSTAFGSINWPVAGGLLGVVSWHLSFAVYVLAVPLGILIATLMPDMKKGMPAVREKVEVRTPFYLYGFVTLENVLFFTVLVFMPQMLRGISSFPLFISLYIVALMVAAVVGSSLGGKIKRSPGRVVAALGLWIAGFLTMSTGSSLVMAGSVILFGIGRGILGSALTDWVEGVPPPCRDTVSAHSQVYGFAGQFVAPVVFSPVVVLGLNNVFLAAAGVCGAVVLVFLGNLMREGEGVHHLF